MSNLLKKSEERGFSFGLTSGVITTLGLLIGLYASTESTIVMIAGILSIAVADAFSDAMGIHVSEEVQHGSSKRVWRATISTFLSKFFFALSFCIPVLIFTGLTAVITCIFYGLTLIAGYTYHISVRKKESPYYPMLEHVLITVIVIIATYFIGHLLKGFQ